MKRWNETVVTDVGNEMLNEMMAGRFLTVTAVYGGTGLVDAGEMAQQTDLLDRKQTVSIINDETTGEERTITLQIKNAEAEYELNQIGIFAKLDAARDPQAEEKMLCIMQDRQEKGATLRGWVAVNDRNHGAGITAEEYESITGKPYNGNE